MMTLEHPHEVVALVLRQLLLQDGGRRTTRGIIPARGATAPRHRAAAHPGESRAANAPACRWHRERARPRCPRRWRADRSSGPGPSQQQEAALDILGDHHRDVDTCVEHQPGDMDERPAVLARRRRIHRDQRHRRRRQRVRCRQCHAEIAAKACIRRCGRERELLRLQSGGKPFGKQDEARIVVGEVHGSG